MDILHLSDLHLHEDSPQLSLDTLWSAPGAALDRAGARFDAIVVSGDLTRRAQRLEYDQLLRFSRRTLIPLLRDGLPGPKEKRVIFVPGNHDVDWTAPIVGDPSEPAALRDAEAIWRRADRDRRRVDLSDGRIKIRTLVREEDYAQRLANCQRFLESFYGDALSQPPDHCFDLVRPAKEGQDWAAHVFEEERVAFLCFNSCHANDRYWRGGHVNPDAVAQCRRTARELPTYFKVAVWHHGLASERGSPDYLALSEIGPIEDLGCRVAFHGHVHKAGLEVPRLLRDRITIVATGSLGAGPSDRPEVVSNQFSVVRLYPTRVAVKVFVRRPEGDQYEDRPIEIHRIHGTTGAADGARARAESIVRDFLVGEDGICRIRLAMTNVCTGDADLPLSVLHTPSRQIVCGDAWVDGERRKVQEALQPDGAVRYSLPATARTIARLSWEYLVANSLALTQEDLRRKNHPSLFANLQSDEDALGYLVRVDCDRLAIKLGFERSPGAAAADATIADAHPLVEAKFAEGGEERWSPVESENARCRVRTDAREASLEVDAPIVGVRYSLVYRPARQGQTIPTAAAELAERLLDLTRNDPTQSSAAIALLSYAVGTSARLVLERPRLAQTELDDALAHARPDAGAPIVPGLGGHWCAYLWNDAKRVLQPTFGEFPPSRWGDAFGSGAGVVGHAFRFGASAIWARNGAANRPPRTSIIFEKRGEGHTDVDWVVGVPLLVAPAGPAIGVVAFAGSAPHGRQDSIGATLSRMARELVAHEEAQREGKASVATSPAVARRERLLEAANLFFWSAVAEGALFAADDRAYATSVLQELAPGGAGAASPALSR
jgi:3',5'-cyclic AMP phosphodiesterase CpdA